MDLLFFDNGLETYMKEFLDVVDVVCLKLTCRGLKARCEIIWPFPKQFTRVRWIVMEACERGRWRVAWDLLRRLDFQSLPLHLRCLDKIPWLQDEKQQEEYSKVVNLLIENKCENNDTIDGACSYGEILVYFQANLDRDWKIENVPHLWRIALERSAILLIKYLWSRFREALFNVWGNWSEVKTDSVLEFAKSNPSTPWILDYEYRSYWKPLWSKTLDHVLKTIKTPINKGWLWFQYVENHRPIPKELEDQVYSFPDVYLKLTNREYQAELFDRMAPKLKLDDILDVFCQGPTLAKVVSYLKTLDPIPQIAFKANHFKIPDIQVLNKLYEASLQTSPKPQLSLVYEYAASLDHIRFFRERIDPRPSFIFEWINPTLAQDPSFREYVSKCTMKHSFIVRPNPLFDVFLIRTFYKWVKFEQTDLRFFDLKALIALDEVYCLDTADRKQIFCYYKDDETMRYFGKRIEETEIDTTYDIGYDILRGKTNIVHYIQDLSNPMAKKMKICKPRSTILAELDGLHYFHLRNLVSKLDDSYFR